MTTYYSLLELKRNASTEEIDSAYRRLSLKYHPQRNKSDVAANMQKFSQISEAYEVLSDPSKKAIYDSLGEAALKEGPLYYKYADNALEIFEKFYATYNPFHELVDTTGGKLQGSMFGSAYGGVGEVPPPPPSDLVVLCECTLEELYMGCMKKVEFQRDVLGLDGKSLRKRKEEIEIEIKPGYQEGTELRFRGKGNEGRSYPNSDLVIKIKEVPHDKYKRKGKALVYKHTISLLDGLCAKPFEIETLDHRLITIPLDEVVTPNTKKCVVGEGMPISKTDAKSLVAEGEEKGDLWITFDIIFPAEIEEKDKAVLKEVLA